jgi:ribonuclease P protein component
MVSGHAWKPKAVEISSNHAGLKAVAGWLFDTTVHVPVGRFAHTNRLTRPREYKPVFRSSCRSVDNYFIVIARNNGMQHARLGMAISGKRVRLAVYRNRLKRIIRESFRKHQVLLSGMDIVVTTNKCPGQINNKIIFSSLQKHWQKLATCKDSS